MAYAAVTVEGGFFPGELLDRIATGQVVGQRPEDFGLARGSRLSDELQTAFSDMRSLWDAFQRRLGYSRESPTTLTREAWMGPLLERLGYGLSYQRGATQVATESYNISHRAGDDPSAPPVHIVGIDQSVDRRDGARRSPHAMVQEYLNRSDSLWGIAADGERLRVLRDSARLSRPTYLEFDLRAMVEAGLYNEFVLLYRLLHRSRLPTSAEDAHECLLERYYQDGIEEGGRVRDHLRDGVEAALRVLGTGFLSHPGSQGLREAFVGQRLNAASYYRQLLRLVYQLLFLMVAEERRLIVSPEADLAQQRVYQEHYSVARLRARCQRPFADDHYSDLWEGLCQTFRLFGAGEGAGGLGVLPLNGELFGPHACPDLEEASCENTSLLHAIYRLSTFWDGRVRRRVNYAALDVEELGSVYESLLDYQPFVSSDGVPRFALEPGTERRQTGSYYTPPELVRELIDAALVPVMEERLASAKTAEERERALLSLRVCDPAAGSGHFLLAAGRRIARELARVRTGEDEPPPDAYRAALRDVIRSCLYAVDKNPLAVDLCKVALWIEGHNAGLPLTFLDHHVKSGDSLVGVADLSVLDSGIPDDAYKRSDPFQRSAATAFRARNRVEGKGQLSLLDHHADDRMLEIAVIFDELARAPDDTVQRVAEKAARYEAARAPGTDWLDGVTACNLWTAAFFLNLAEQRAFVPTTAILRAFRERPAAGHGQVVGTAAAEALNPAHRFFHWPLEFPEVFVEGGFDIVLGNPPFGNAIEDRTARNDLESNYFSFALAETARGAYDRANLFLGRTVRLLKPEGSYGLVCPRATASGRSSEPLRSLMDREAPPHMLCCPDNPGLFRGAAVFVCLIAGVKGRRPEALRVSTSGDMSRFRFSEVPLGPRLQGRTWWQLVQSGGEAVQIEVGSAVTVETTASVWAGCVTSVAYELAPHVSDDLNGRGPRLVTTGAIDPFKCRWGATKIRFLKRDYHYPRWPPHDPSKGAASARERQRGRKLLIAGLSKVIEAVFDRDGDLAGVVSTYILVPAVREQWANLRFAAVLNSAVFSFVYFQRFGAKQMSGGNCTIGKSELLSMPVPHDILDESPTGPISDAWAAYMAPEALDRSNAWTEVQALADWLLINEESAEWFAVRDRLHGHVSALYGLSPEDHSVVRDWWQRRRA